MNVDKKPKYQSPENGAIFLKLEARISKLQARLAAAEVDAARYQWLRSRAPGGTYRVMGIIYSEGGAGVDAEIDAARAQTVEIEPVKIELA